jgi:hypothetical protein
VVPLASNAGQASDILGQLVFSALEAKYFTVDSTLRSFGTRLWAWCKTQEALFAGYGTSATAACGTVHDALAATELLHSSAPAAATNLTVVVTRGIVEQWGDWRFATVYYRVRNAGTARFNGRVYVEHVSVNGDLLYDQRDTVLDLQPGASSDELVIYGDMADLTDDMPEPRSVLHLWPETASLDSVAADNLTPISWRTLAYPAGGDQPLVAADGAITVRLAQRGWWELQNKDIKARLLYRRALGDEFVDVSATIEHPEPDWKSLPQVEDGYLVHMIARPTSPLTLTQRQLGGFANRAIGKPFAKARFVENANSDLNVVDGGGNVVEGPLLLLVLNADSSMKTHPGLPYVFCLNCNGVRGGDYAVLGFAKDIDLTGHFPADLLPMLEKLVPLTPPPTTPQLYYEMDFAHWLQFGDPIASIPREVQQLNAGP